MKSWKVYLPWGLMVIAVFVLVGGYMFLDARYKALLSERDSLSQKILSLEQSLAQAQNEATTLRNSLVSEKNRNDSLQEEFDDISDTVGAIQKFVNTDPELLQKYSKVYFLNEHYAPSDIVQIPNEYVYPPDTEEYFHAQIWPKLEELLEDAAEDGVDLRVISGYRSFAEQTTLKGAYRMTYGSGANTFSADQGYSEHQLGTTIDFTTAAIGSSFSGFDTTPEFSWLEENAHRYGFILSYPSGNIYYQYEPWHWRYVGEDLAKKLHREDQHFYDLDQREIDTYLGSFFD